MELTGKFDLVITSHLLEDLTDPQAPSLGESSALLFEVQHEDDLYCTN